MRVITDNWEDGSAMTGICCLECREETTARLSVAHPVRLYAVELICRECLEPLTPAFDQFTDEVAE